MAEEGRAPWDWSFWEGKRVLITGVCGTVGSELLRQLRSAGVELVRGIDNAESPLFFLREENAGQDNVQLLLGDVRDRNSMERSMRGVDVVLHTAAYKHVSLGERSPRDVVQTNVGGVQNVIDAAYVNQVQRVLLTSSDKAVNPTNVMGTSKLMGERLITAASQLSGSSTLVLASNRFGNVLGSRGSVIPLFRRQIAAGGPVTLTVPSMTRFIMTLEEAARLVLGSVVLARGGEVFVTKMPVVRIQDLAEVMIEELAPRFGHDPSRMELRVVGARPGEKMHEELLNSEELRRTIDRGSFFVILPALQGASERKALGYPEELTPVLDQPYTSDQIEPMEREALRAFLRANRLLDHRDVSD